MQINKEIIFAPSIPICRWVAIRDQMMHKWVLFYKVVQFTTLAEVCKFADDDQVECSL
jgi:hypothetical protein